MNEEPISHIQSYKYVPKVGKYIVKLAREGEKQLEVWMTEKQLDQIERCFSKTPNGYSSQRKQVYGIWNDKGYYAYARIEITDFIEPPQFSMKDMIERDI